MNIQLKDEYEILSSDVVVATWKNNNLNILNEDLLPLYLKYHNDINSWLESRAIDSTRVNSRLLKKALGLKEKDDISTSLFSSGACITDNFWIRKVGLSLTYNDVKFKSDDFSKLALTGDLDTFNLLANSKNKKTPELTNTGSYEKCWKLINGSWYMLKKANHDEMFSEIFVSKLGKMLSMNMVVYEKGKGYVKSKDFTNNNAFNFEPASTFMNDNDDYFDVIDKLNVICPTAIDDYIKMIYLDTIVFNVDRHTNNFGLLRDVNSGMFISLAPNYDNNMSLISRGYPKSDTSNDLLIKLFNQVLDKYPKYKDELPKLSVDMVKNCIGQVPIKVKSEKIISLVMNRYNGINLNFVR